MPAAVESLEAAFRAFGFNPGSPLDGALLVSKVVYPATDERQCREHIARLASEIGREATPERLLAILRQHGFQGAEQYYEPANSALALVLDTRRGIPISLAALIIGVAEALEMSAVGINFPGHFLVSLAGATVDPFTLEVLEAATLTERINASGVSVEQAMKPATPVEMVLRMLNNLRSLAVARGDHTEALTICDYQLTMASDAFPILLARGESWFALGAEQQAMRELERALPLAPNPAIAAQLTAKLREFSARRRTLH